MRRCLPALLLFLTAALRAAPLAPDISGQNFSYDQNSLETVISGGARLVYGTLLLTADEIRYNRTTGLAIATGHVVLTRGPQRLLADRLSYRLSDGFFQVQHVRLGEYPVYISADSAAGNRSAVKFTDATVTLQEPDVFAPTLRAATLTYQPDKNLSAQQARLGIGPMPLLSLPNFNQSVHEPLLSYFDFTAGYRSTLGGYAGIGLHLPVLPDVKLGGDVDFFTRRGFLLGPSGTYDWSAGDQEMAGFLKSGYIHDYGDRGDDILMQPVPSDRGYVEWQHQQSIGENLTLTGDLNYWSDSQIIRDFHPLEFQSVQEPDNFLESDYTGQNYVVSAFTRFAPNNFYLVQERLPEITLDLLPLNVGAGFYERFSGGIAVLREGGLSNLPALESNRFDAFYELARPIAPTSWFTFTPVAGARLTYYANATDGRDTYTRTLGEIGFDAVLRTSGEWDYQNKLWNIDGLRHLFTPKVSYRYIPEAEKGQAYIPPVDTDTFSPYLQPLDLGDMRNIDQLHRTDTARVEFDNTLQTRDGKYGSRDLLSLDVADDFRFSRDPGDPAVSQLQAELSAMPVRWMQLDVLEVFAPQSRQHRELDTGLTLRDGEQRSITFGSNYLRGGLPNEMAAGQLEDYSIEYRERLNEVFSLTERLSYDAHLHRFDQQIIGLTQNLHHIWRIRYELALLNGDKSAGHLGLNLEVELLKF